MMQGHQLRRVAPATNTNVGPFAGKCWCGISVQATNREAAEKLHDELWNANEVPFEATVPINPGDKLVLLSRTGKALHFGEPGAKLVEKLVSEAIMSAEDYAEDGEAVFTAEDMAAADMLLQWLRENIGESK